MKEAFNLPRTPKCTVEYYKGGVRYVATIDTPTSQAALQFTMFQRGVHVCQITAVNEFYPLVRKPR